MNAYMLFCKKNRTEVKEKYPGLSNREISQILGKMWHDLDKQEWQKYTDMSFEVVSFVTIHLYSNFISFTFRRRNV